MVEKQKFHRVADRLVNALRGRADFHAFGNWSRAGRHQLRKAFRLNEAHPATAFDTDVGVVAIAGNLDAHVVRHLDDRFAFFSLVCLSVNRELGHKELD